MEFILKEQPRKLRKMKREPKETFENIKEFMIEKDENLFSKYGVSNGYFENIQNNDVNPRFEQILSKKYSINNNEYKNILLFMKNTNYSINSYKECTFILKNNEFLEITLYKYKYVYNEFLDIPDTNYYIPFYFSNDPSNYVQNKFVIFYLNKENKSVKYRHISENRILNTLVPK
jgi:hypothetical protein